MKGITLTGLHMHVSSKSKKIDVYQELTQRACEIAKREDIKLQYLDIGGGFFGGGDAGKAYESYVTTIAMNGKKYMQMVQTCAKLFKTLAEETVGRVK